MAKQLQALEAYKIECVLESVSFTHSLMQCIRNHESYLLIRDCLHLGKSNFLSSLDRVKLKQQLFFHKCAF